MKAVKIFAILILVYVGIVIVFESLLGYYQPENQSTLIITTTDENGIGSVPRSSVELNSVESKCV